MPQRVKQEIDPLLALPQVRAALSVSTGTVYNLIKKGKLARARKLHGTSRVAWRQSDIQAYLDGLPPVDLRPLPGSGRAAA